MNRVIQFIKNNHIKFVWIAVTLAAGIIGALLSGSFDVYSQYDKPPLSPPGIVFPIVWTLLYILMGLAAGVIAESYDLDKSRALKLYIIQLIINILWPLIFFRFNAPKLALFWLVILVVAVVLTIRSFYSINCRAALLMLPYLAWCLFATYLNFGIVVLNS